MCAIKVSAALELVCVRSGVGSQTVRRLLRLTLHALSVIFSARPARRAKRHRKQRSSGEPPQAQRLFTDRNGNQVSQTW